jgi:hypothetical protein
MYPELSPFLTTTGSSEILSSPANGIFQTRQEQIK